MDSVDNIRKKINSILLSDKPSDGFKHLLSIGWLEVLFPELQKCVDVQQDKLYHKCDVFHHSIYTCDSIKPDITLRLAALLHDIGKPACVKRTIKDGIDKISFHKHEVVGSIIAEQMLTRLKYDTVITNNVKKLVRLHMYHYIGNYYTCDKCGRTTIIKTKLPRVCRKCGSPNIQYRHGWTDKAMKDFIKRSGITKNIIKNLDNFPLFLLRAAERYSKKCLPTITEKQKDFQARIAEVFNRK